MVQSRTVVRQPAHLYQATSWEILPDEPIGPLIRPGRSKRIASVVLALAMAGGACWAWVDPPGFSAVVVRAVPTAKALAREAWDLLPSFSRQQGQGGLQADRSARGEVPSNEPLPPLPALEAPASASTEVAPSTQPVGTAYASPAEAHGSGAEAILRRRAEAAGLHPDLSLALLERLSAADFKTAAVAVEKALAELDDNAVLVWPRQRMPNEALFVIHFVTGSAGDCRRYVVSIDKDRWSTTALPMEKCGVTRRSTPAGISPNSKRS